MWLVRTVVTIGSITDEGEPSPFYCDKEDCTTDCCKALEMKCKSIKSFGVLGEAMAVVHLTSHLSSVTLLLCQSFNAKRRHCWASGGLFAVWNDRGYSVESGRGSSCPIDRFVVTYRATACSCSGVPLIHIFFYIPLPAQPSGVRYICFGSWNTDVIVSWSAAAVSFLIVFAVIATIVEGEASSDGVVNEDADCGGKNLPFQGQTYSMKYSAGFGITVVGSFLALVQTGLHFADAQNGTRKVHA